MDDYMSTYIRNILILILVACLFIAFAGATRFSVENKSELVLTRARVVEKSTKHSRNSTGVTAFSVGNRIVHFGGMPISSTTYRLRCQPCGGENSYTIDVDRDTYDNTAEGDNVVVTLYVDKESGNVLDLELGDTTK